MSRETKGTEILKLKRSFVLPSLQIRVAIQQHNISTHFAPHFVPEFVLKLPMQNEYKKGQKFQFMQVSSSKKDSGTNSVTDFCILNRDPVNKGTDAPDTSRGVFKLLLGQRSACSKEIECTVSCSQSVSQCLGRNQQEENYSGNLRLSKHRPAASFIWECLQDVTLNYPT